MTPPTASLAETSLGYNYWRCRAGGTDETIYVHALCAIAGGEDPHDVFAENTDVHHEPLSDWLDLDEHVPAPPLLGADTVDVPVVDVPHGVTLEDRYDHRVRNLERNAPHA